jgi:hypothetical protein
MLLWSCLSADSIPFRGMTVMRPPLHCEIRLQSKMYRATLQPPFNVFRYIPIEELQFVLLSEFRHSAIENTTSPIGSPLALILIDYNKCRSRASHFFSFEIVMSWVNEPISVQRRLTESWGQSCFHLHT